MKIKSSSFYPPALRFNKIITKSSEEVHGSKYILKTLKFQYVEKLLRAFFSDTKSMLSQV